MHTSRRERDNYPPPGRKRRFEDTGSPCTSKQPRNDNQSVKYCQYCGDDTSQTHKECLTTHKSRSEKAIEDFKLVVGEYNVLCIALHVNYLNGQPKEIEPKVERKRKQNKRNLKLKELLEKVTALRNSDGGFLLVHLVGLQEGDICFSFFHEFADDKLNQLIADGSQFDDVYKKQQLSKYKKYLDKLDKSDKFDESDDTDKAVESDKSDKVKKLVEYTDFLVIHITAGKSLTTANFNSIDSLDKGIVDSTNLTVSYFLKRRRPSEEFSDNFHNPGIHQASDIEHLQESRSIQFKRYFPGEDKPVDVVSLLLKNRLSEYASAFTKLPEGGSLFFGVWEKDITILKSYYSKEPVVECVPIEDEPQFKEALREELLKNLLVCDYDGKPLSTDFVSVELLPTCCGNEDICTKSDSSSPHYIVQVSFKPVTGIVFHDKAGPVAYRIVNKDVQPFTLKEWFEITLLEINDAKSTTA